MQYASENPINERVGILFGLAILGKMCERLGGGGAFKIGDFREILDFLRLFADKCHHGKGEGLHFPVMAGAPRRRGVAHPHR